MKEKLLLGRLNQVFKDPEIAREQRSMAEIIAVSAEDVRPFEEAWQEIKASLEGTKPRFKNWRKAMSWVRGKKPSRPRKK
jgi:hypothetical protein